jgi:hypothetical protein
MALLSVHSFFTGPQLGNRSPPDCSGGDSIGPTHKVTIAVALAEEEAEQVVEKSSTVCPVDDWAARLFMCQD